MSEEAPPVVEEQTPSPQPQPLEVPHDLSHIERPPGVSDTFVRETADQMAKDKKRLLRLIDDGDGDRRAFSAEALITRAAGIAGATILTGLIFDATLAAQFPLIEKTPPHMPYLILRLPAKPGAPSTESVLSEEHEKLYVEEYKVPPAVMDRLCAQLRKPEQVGDFTDVLVKPEHMMLPLPVASCYDVATKKTQLITAVAVKVELKLAELVLMTTTLYVMASVLTALTAALKSTTLSDKDWLQNYSVLRFQMGRGTTDSEHIYYASLCSRADMRSGDVWLTGTQATFRQRELVAAELPAAKKRAAAAAAAAVAAKTKAAAKAAARAAAKAAAVDDDGDEKKEKTTTV